jgi:hypothetical protein
MRAVVILVAIVASIASTCEANAQASTSQPATPQVSPPQVSPPMSQSSEPPRGIPQAPVGHRQPRASDVPNEGNVARSQVDEEIDSKLKICRGC